MRKAIHLVTTQAVIASEAKQSPSRKEEIASSQKTLLAMTRAEQLPSTKLSTGFDENIYGCDLVVEFVERLREERRYADIEELKAQIERDIAQARLILAEAGKRGTRNE